MPHNGMDGSPDENPWCGRHLELHLSWTKRLENTNTLSEIVLATKVEGGYSGLTASLD